MRTWSYVFTRWALIFFSGGGVALGRNREARKGDGKVKISAHIGTDQSGTRELMVRIENATLSNLYIPALGDTPYLDLLIERADSCRSYRTESTFEISAVAADYIRIPPKTIRVIKLPNQEFNDHIVVPEADPNAVVAEKYGGVPLRVIPVDFAGLKDGQAYVRFSYRVGNGRDLKVIRPCSISK